MNLCGGLHFVGTIMSELFWVGCDEQRQHCCKHLVDVHMWAV